MRNILTVFKLQMICTQCANSLLGRKLMKEKSFIKLDKFPFDFFNGDIPLSEIISLLEVGAVDEEYKKDIVVVKECFILLDSDKSKIGVFTRSSSDHHTKIGQCSILLSGNFCKSECTITENKEVIYDVNARLHLYMSQISGIMIKGYKGSSIPAVFVHDKTLNKRYIFFLFFISCDSSSMPLCYSIENRRDDVFIGMRDYSDIVSAIKKYNQSDFRVDRAILNVLEPKRQFPSIIKKKIHLPKGKRTKSLLLTPEIGIRIAEINIVKLSII